MGARVTRSMVRSGQCPHPDTPSKRDRKVTFSYPLTTFVPDTSNSESSERGGRKRTRPDHDSSDNHNPADQKQGCADALLEQIKTEAEGQVTYITPNNDMHEKMVVYGLPGSGKTAMLNSMIDAYDKGRNHLPEVYDINAAGEANSITLNVEGRELEIVEPKVSTGSYELDDFAYARQQTSGDSVVPDEKRTAEQQEAAEIYRQLASADKIILCSSMQSSRFAASEQRLLDQLLISLYDGKEGLRKNLGKVELVLTFSCYCTPSSGSGLDESEYREHYRNNWLTAVNGKYGLGRYGLALSDESISIARTHHERTPSK